MHCTTAASLEMSDEPKIIVIGLLKTEEYTIICIVEIGKNR